MTSLFISFEGTDGCGKSTQIRALAARLEEAKAGHNILQLREPGGTSLSEAIRKLLQHDDAGEGMSAESELLLFAAARAQLTREKIRPALASGAIVLSDRFMDSTTVYQGVARALSPKAVAGVNDFAIGSTKPDLTILIDLPPEIGLKRLQIRSKQLSLSFDDLPSESLKSRQKDRNVEKPDRIERESLEFFQAVRAGYLKLAGMEKERFLVINGNQTPENVEHEIWDAVTKRLT